ncbi:sphingosine-1-phosphate phosphatase 2 isoform X3 [Fundulus heteroclitus]|uniref:sphingosine-1-phosphate phosphatase 2 isoform X3 n=1 Tax=Fundulus heteroclitus TaxID=8078 RepID=UPI00165AF204|nr:sphingosine-1-phosphate phosphatase 2 isoform X3 [Fundulus heteroclitus]
MRPRLPEQQRYALIFRDLLHSRLPQIIPIAHRRFLLRLPDMQDLLAYLQDPELVARFQRRCGLYLMEGSNRGSGRITGEKPRGQQEGSWDHQDRNSNYEYKENPAGPVQDCRKPRYEVRNWLLHFLFLLSAGLGHEVFYITCLPCIHWNLDPFLCRRLVNMWAVLAVAIMDQTIVPTMGGRQVGDVHRPGDEGPAEASSPSLAACGQAGDARGRGVRTAVHPRHGRHRHLLHASAQRSLQSTVLLPDGSADRCDAVIYGVSEPALYWHALSSGRGLWHFDHRGPDSAHLPLVGILRQLPALQPPVPHRCSVAAAPPELHVPRAGPLQHHTGGHHHHSRRVRRLLGGILAERPAGQHV